MTPLAFDWLFDSKVLLFELDRRRLKIFLKILKFSPRQWHFSLTKNDYNNDNFKSFPEVPLPVTHFVTQTVTKKTVCIFVPFSIPSILEINIFGSLYKFLRNENLNFRFSPRILERGWPRAWARVGWWSENGG